MNHAIGVWVKCHCGRDAKSGMFKFQDGNGGILDFYCDGCDQVFRIDYALTALSKQTARSG